MPVAAAFMVVTRQGGGAWVATVGFGCGVSATRAAVGCDGVSHWHRWTWVQLIAVNVAGVSTTRAAVRCDGMSHWHRWIRGQLIGVNVAGEFEKL